MNERVTAEGGRSECVPVCRGKERVCKRLSPLIQLKDCTQMNLNERRLDEGEAVRLLGRIQGR